MKVPEATRARMFLIARKSARTRGPGGLPPVSRYLKNPPATPRPDHVEPSYIAHRMGAILPIRHSSEAGLAQVRHALVIQNFFDLKRIANPAPAMAAIETAM